MSVWKRVPAKNAAGGTPRDPVARIKTDRICAQDLAPLVRRPHPQDGTACTTTPCPNLALTTALTANNGRPNPVDSTEA